jgi:hypothetical protein
MVLQGVVMSRGSIFDPEGWSTEQSGDRFTGSRADSNSHMPPDVVDGEVSEEEAADLDKLAEAREETEKEGELNEDKTNPETEP